VALILAGLRIRSKFVQDRREHIIGEMIYKILHREQPLPAGRASGRHDSVSALRYRRQMIHERGEVMTGISV
jgi:hypothetical protein